MRGGFILGEVRWSLALVALLAACAGEKATDTSGDDTDGDTDPDTDTDTDSETEPSNNDDIDHAEEVEIVDGDLTTVDDAIEKAGDRDFFKINATMGEAYWIYVQGGGDNGQPDCVVRVYDDKGVEVAYQDDLPYRIYGTDPGVMFRATADATYYVEVLEWADWAGDTPVGGASWDYTLYLAPTTVLYETGMWEIHATENDTIEQERASIEAESYSWYSDPWSTENNFYMALGEFDKASDVDVFGLPITGTDPGFIEFSIFQGINTDIDPILEIVNDDGEVVAHSEGEGAYFHAPHYDYFQGRTVGVSFSYDTPGNYYVRVKDAAGGSGVGAWYALIGNVYGWNTDVVAFHTEPGTSDLPGTSTVEAILNDTTSGNGEYGFVIGKFGANGDDVDTIHVPASAVAGQFLTVMVGTSTNGSLVDAKVTVFDKNKKQIATADAHPTLGDGDDPSILDLELTTGGDFWIQIDNVNKKYGDGAFYEVYFVTGDDALGWDPEG